jgi:hypothetical protein
MWEGNVPRQPYATEIPLAPPPLSLNGKAAAAAASVARPTSTLSTSWTQPPQSGFGTPPRAQIRSRSNVERRQQSLSIDGPLNSGSEGPLCGGEKGGASSSGGGGRDRSAGPPPTGPTHRRTRTEPQPSFGYFFDFADAGEETDASALMSPTGYTKL